MIEFLTQTPNASPTSLISRPPASPASITPTCTPHPMPHPHPHPARLLSILHWLCFCTYRSFCLECPPLQIPSIPRPSANLTSIQLSFCPQDRADPSLIWLLRHLSPSAVSFFACELHFSAISPQRLETLIFKRARIQLLNQWNEEQGRGG